MLKVNDIVLYGAAGACTVREFCKKQVGGTERGYAVLETEAPPKTTIYLPLENEALMSKIKPVPSADEILEMIRSLPLEEDPWIEDEERRRQCCREILAGCDRAALLRLVRTLYLHQTAQRRQGKSCTAPMNGFLRRHSACCTTKSDSCCRFPRTRCRISSPVCSGRRRPGNKRQNPAFLRAAAHPVQRKKDSGFRFRPEKEM